MRLESPKTGDIGEASSSPATLGEAARDHFGPFNGTFSNLILPGHMHVFKQVCERCSFFISISLCRRRAEDAVVPDITIAPGIFHPFSDVFYNPSN